MINEKDYINKNGRLYYKMTCDKCGADRGHKRKIDSKINALCRSCSQLGVKDAGIYSNVDFNDFIENTKSKSYKTSCIQCGKDKGYVRKKDALKVCLSCAAFNRNKNMSTELKEQTKIKISCTQRNIDIEEFDEFSNTANERERQLFKSSGLREECFKNADYTCQSCRSRGVTLNAHHIKSWKEYPEERFNQNNLQCLCEDCHKKIHNK